MADIIKLVGPEVVCNSTPNTFSRGRLKKFAGSRKRLPERKEKK